MTKLLLSTSNIMNDGPSIIRRDSYEKSNTELVKSLRANFELSKQEYGELLSTKNPQENGVTNGHDNPRLARRPIWTAREGNMLFIPSIDFSSSGLAEDRTQYDITVKLFFLPSTKSSTRAGLAEEAVSLVLKELHVCSIDLLIVSFPGISFDADDDEDEDSGGDQSQEAERLEEMIDNWQTLEQLHVRGIVAQIGLAEFGSERLRRFLPKVKVRPSVDQINVRDCCVVPKSLILYAKQEKIELLTHNDCTNILPKGTIRELLGTGDQGADLSIEGDLTGDIEPQWVVKYTAVVRDRGVIENKGYFALAEIGD